LGVVLLGVGLGVVVAEIGFVVYVVFGPDFEKLHHQ
jgi:hypothetical protein